MKWIIVTVLFAGFGFACKAQDDSTMVQAHGEIEKYDFAATENGTKGVRFMRGQTLVIIGKISSGGITNEYAPACDFYTTYKTFHPNGMLREKGCYYFRTVAFGEWEYYNEHGDLINTINEDTKFGKIKPQDIISLLEKEDWFDRKTGANKLLYAPEYILNKDSTYTVINPPNFRTDGYFTYEINRWMDVSFDSSNGYTQWFVSIEPTAINNWTWTIYKIDGDTGEFEKEVKYVEPAIE